MVLIWSISALITLACCQEEETGKGNLFEGDIILDENVKQYYKEKGSDSRDKRSGDSSNYIWNYKTTDNINKGSIIYTVPYIDADMDDFQATVYMKIAMKRWNQGTCILFVPRTTESNFLNFRPGKSCSSHVGMRGGSQNVTIGRNCQYNIGSIMHELGHVLGLFHEHTRSDRDSHIKILQENLRPGAFNSNFRKMSRDPPYIKEENYDYISIMHYGKTAYSRHPFNLTTIQTLDPVYQNLIGQRAVISPTDVEKVNAIYNCDCKIINRTVTYPRIYWGRCTLFYFFKYDCQKEEILTETRSKKMCTELI